MTEDDALAALGVAAVCGKLAAVVSWCVNHEGETLSDNPHQLRFAKRVLAEFHALAAEPSNGRGASP